MKKRTKKLLSIALAFGLAVGPARAHTLQVGPGQGYDSPSAALKEAADGDTVEIAPGEYFDCVRVRAANLTIRGTGPGAVLTDQVCDGKAIIVAQADNLTVRDLTLQRARVADGNGAGIRAEGRNISIEHVQFRNSQSGLMAGDNPDSTITVRDSTFRETGICEGDKCGNSISIGHVARLIIERTDITGNRGGHQIVSGADLTELRHDTLQDGPTGSASFQLMLPHGGTLVMEDCAVEKGPHATNLRAAILLDGHATAPMTFRRNNYIDDTGTAVPFILDWSDGTPVLDRNTIPASDSEISTAGALAHHLRDTLSTMKAQARGMAGSTLRGLKSLLGH